MKRKTLFSTIFTVIAVAAVLSGCAGEKKQKNVNFVTVQSISHADTLRVYDATRDFMELLKCNKVDSAISLLCDIRNDSAFELGTKRRAQLLRQFRQFPVLDYELETSQFSSHEYATATYRYKFMENPTTDPNYPTTLRLTIEATYKNGKFRLVLHDESFITR